MSREWETVWTFDTPNFRVTLEVTPEDMDPADSFEFQEDIDAVRERRVEWFIAKVAVYFGDDPEHLEEIGADVLGGCAYKTVREFYTSHRDPDPMNRNCSIMRATKGQNVVICHYFPDMVQQAIAEARRHMARVHSIRMRVAP
jgi:hypothetical protein